MKANELMIGDWVECTYWTPSKQLKVAEIRRIIDDEIKIGVYCNNLVLIFRQSEVRPIPLTPKILEKNGWVYIAEDKVFYSENLKGELPWIYYITDGSNEVFRMQDFCNLQYVHELQHALRLCGIEKDIVL